MKFIELLETVEFGPIWECLQSYYGLKDWLFIDYQKVYNELRNRKPAEIEDEMLLVVDKVPTEEVGGEGFDFEVFGIKSGEQQRYGLEFEPWEEWLSYQVHQESVTLYGPVAVAAHSLYELTFIGFSNEGVKSEKAKINEIYKDIMNEERRERRKCKCNLPFDATHISQMLHRLCISPGELADAVGVNTQTVILWKKGLRKPSRQSKKNLYLLEKDDSLLKYLRHV